MPVDTPSQSHAEREPDREIMRDLIDGERTIKAKGETYLPRYLSMSGPNGNAAYDAYVTRADYFDGLSRARAGLMGMLFRKDPTIVVPAGMSDEFAGDLTKAGRDAASLARLHAAEVIDMGRHGLLVDYTDVDPDEAQVVTRADMRRLNIRPYVATYAASSILEVLYQEVRQRRYMTRVRLLETTEIQSPKNEFETLPRQRVRVLELMQGADGGMVYHQRLFEQVVDDNGELKDAFIEDPAGAVVPTVDGAPLDHIPFYFTDSDDMAETEQEPMPPLLALANKQLSLYRSLADVEHGAAFCALPQAYIILSAGRENRDQEFLVGSQQAWLIEDDKAQVGVLSFNGEGLKILESRIAEKKQEMAILGARMLEPQRAQTEAFGTAIVHRHGEISVLQAISQHCNATLTAALTELARWNGQTTPFTVEINRDFIPVQADPAMVRSMLEALIAGKIPGEEWWSFLRAGEVLTTAKTWQEAQAEIEAERADDMMGMSFGGDSQQQLDDDLEDAA